MDMKGLILSKIKNTKKAKVFKKFLRFLKENGVYYEFFRIMKSGPSGQYQSQFGGCLVNFFNICYPEYWTTCCFRWVEYNKDGFEWGKIHSKWRDYIIGEHYEV
jgi:hypothetical protein